MTAISDCIINAQRPVIPRKECHQARIKDSDSHRKPEIFVQSEEMKPNDIICLNHLSVVSVSCKMQSPPLLHRSFEACCNPYAQIMPWNPALMPVFLCFLIRHTINYWESACEEILRPNFFFNKSNCEAVRGYCLVCRYFLFISSQMRGPFLPAYFDKPWHTVLSDKINENVKLVGSTILCTSLIFDAAQGAIDHPHVQASEEYNSEN